MSERKKISRESQTLEPELLARVKKLQNELQKRVEELTQRDETIDELQRRNAELEKLAFTDSLTGIPNRHGWGEHVGVMIDLQLERGIPEHVYMVLIDIDNFKSVNDTYGHAAGDQVLKSVAATISKVVRDYDVVGRLGGEEFAAALFGASSEDVEAKAEVIRHAVEQAQYNFDGVELGVTVSVGVGTVYEQYAEGQDPAMSDALSKADSAMYDAKRRGKNQVSVHPEAA